MVENHKHHDSPENQNHGCNAKQGKQSQENYAFHIFRLVQLFNIQLAWHESVHARLLQFSRYHPFIKAYIRISVKALKRNKNLKTQLARVPFCRHCQFLVRMNGQPWPKGGRPVSLTRLFTALRKSLVKSVQS